MSKTITEQIEALQQENAHFKELEKLFDKAIKLEFGCSKKSIHNLLKKEQTKSEFEQKICAYYHLDSPADQDAFLACLCSENSLHFYKNEH